MKKWKVIHKITLIIILLVIVFLIINLIDALLYKGYPYPALGLDIYNWKDRFLLNTAFYSYIFGIPFIIDVVLFIVSSFKLKNNNLSNKNR